jgi:hypothetical protein
MLIILESYKLHSTHFLEYCLRVYVMLAFVPWYSGHIRVLLSFASSVFRLFSIWL